MKYFATYALIKVLIQAVSLSALILYSSFAAAVVSVEVETSDVPMVRSGSVSFTDIDGEERDARVRFVGGVTVIEIDGPTDKIKGGEINIAPRDGSARFSPVIPMDWNGKSPLRLDANRQEVTDAPAPMRLYAGVNWDFILSLGDGEQDIPEWGSAAGIAFAPGDEHRVQASDKERSIDQLGISVVTPELLKIGGLPKFRVRATYLRSSSDDDGQASVPIGGENVFGVFDAEHPTLGTGLFAGPSGVDTNFDYDWDRDEYRLGVSWRATADLFCGISVDPRFDIFWGTEKVDWRSTTVFPGIPNLSIQTHREIDSDFWGANLGADFEKPLGSGFAFNFGAGLIYQDRDSTTHSHADIDLVGTPESLLVRNSDSDRKFGTQWGIGVSYDASKHVRLSLKYDIVTGVGNLGGTGPVDGDDVLAGQQVRADTETGYQVGRFSFAYRF